MSTQHSLLVNDVHPTLVLSLFVAEIMHSSQKGIGEDSNEDPALS